jgi:hypothetical protein
MSEPVLPAAAAVGIAAAFFAFLGFFVAESFATGALRRWAFRIGPRVLRQRIDSIPLAQLPARGSLDGLIYGVQPDGACLLLATRRRGSFGPVSPFPFKGTIRAEGGETVLEARLPLGASVFVGLWALGWFAGGAVMLLANPVTGLVLLLIGLGLAWGLRRAVIPAEKDRLLSAVERLREAACARPTPPAEGG